MAITFFSGFETGDLGEWASTNGSPTVVDTIKKTGDYGMLTNGNAEYVDAGLGTSAKRAKVDFYIPTISTITDQGLLGNTGVQALNVRVNTSKKLDLYENTTLKDTGDTTIADATSYLLCIVTSGTSAKVFLNGSEEMSATVTDGCHVPSIVGQCVGSAVSHYFDNAVFDDTASLTDLGDIRVLRASPNAAGQYAEFDTVSGYTNCDEVPASDVDYVDDSGVSVIHRETYNLQDSTTIGVGASDTVKAINIWMRGYDSGNSAQGITVRDDGTDYETEALFGKAFTWKNKLYDTNAPRASAWTPAIFNAFQSGGYSEGSKDVWMSCVMVMVAFIPVSGQDYPISLSPGLTVSATVAYKAAWDRGMSPGLTATITIARALAYDRGTSPGLTVSITIAKILGRLITTTANLTVSSAVARFMTYTRATTSNLTASVTVAKSFGKKIATTANLIVSTAIAMSKGFVRAVIPNLTASATVSKAVAYKRATTPGLTVSATIARIVAYHISTQSALSVAVSIVKSLGRTITTSPGLTVSVTVVKSWGRIITTSPGLTISTTIVKSWGRTITTTANLVVSVVVIAVKESGIRLARAWGIIFG